MAKVHGRPLTDNEIARVGQLLAETELTFPQIATRMSCSQSLIVGINRRLGIRVYNGKRTQWQVRTLHSVDEVFAN